MACTERDAERVYQYMRETEHPESYDFHVTSPHYLLAPTYRQIALALKLSQRYVRECVELADRFGFQLTGGSDYHGLPKPKIALGSGKGGLRVARHVYDKLMEYRASCGMAD